MTEKSSAAPAATSNAIAEFSATEAGLAELRDKYKGIVVDCATKDGMQFAIKGRAELRSLRTTLEKRRQEIKAPLLERERLIDAEAKRITAAVLELEEPLDNLIKAEETRKEDERKAREEAERQRIAVITERINSFGALASTFVGQRPQDIAARLETLRAETVNEWAGEFFASAENARQRAVAALEQLHAGAIALQKQREEEARLAAEREAELTRLRQEAEARAREDEQRRIAEQQRIVAEAKARAEAEAAHKARLDAEERAAREKREAEDRAHRERIAREEAEARAKREALEAEERKAREAREAQERQAREARQAEEQRLEAERQRVEAARREVEAKQAQLLGAREMLVTWLDRYGALDEFKEVRKHIAAFLAKPGKPEPKELAA